MERTREAPISPYTPAVRHGIKRLTMISSMLGGALVGAVACSTNHSVPAVSAQGDPDVLNFALNLEYLEAEFYSMAVTGKTIEANGQAITGTGTQGATTGGAMVNFTDSFTKAVAAEIYQDELDHVQFLRAALGSYAVAKPTINLDGLGTTPGADMLQSTFLVLARAFEDTGVSAYGGAAPLLMSKTILGYAAQILAVEAYHAGNIRLLVAQQNISTKQTDSQDVLPPPSGTQYFTTYPNPVSASPTSGGLAVIRTVPQVVSIVTPFFPNGINGVIQ